MFGNRMMRSMARAAMQASLSFVFIEKFSLRIEVVHGQDADRAPLKLAKAEGEPVLDAGAAGTRLRRSRKSSISAINSSAPSCRNHSPSSYWLML